MGDEISVYDTPQQQSEVIHHHENVNVATLANVKVNTENIKKKNLVAVRHTTIRCLDCRYIHR